MVTAQVVSFPPGNYVTTCMSWPWVTMWLLLLDDPTDRLLVECVQAVVVVNMEEQKEWVKPDTMGPKYIYNIQIVSIKHFSINPTWRVIDSRECFRSVHSLYNV